MKKNMPQMDINLINIIFNGEPIPYRKLVQSIDDIIDLYIIPDKSTMVASCTPELNDSIRTYSESRYYRYSTISNFKEETEYLKNKNVMSIIFWDGMSFEGVKNIRFLDNLSNSYYSVIITSEVKQPVMNWLEMLQSPFKLGIKNII